MSRADPDMREKWLEMRSRRRAEDRRRGWSRQSAGEAHRRSVDAQKLLGRPEWDWLLVELQGMLERRQRELDRVHESLTGGSGLSTEQLRQVRERGIGLRSEILLLQTLMRVPEQIVERGEEGLAVLKEIEAEEPAA